MYNILIIWKRVVFICVADEKINRLKIHDRRSYHALSTEHIMNNDKRDTIVSHISLENYTEEYSSSFATLSLAKNYFVV